jgi:KDO2-lipid IV(A) lauroyltransferase
LLADRDLTSTGIEVEFFGSPARMPAGPAALACMTGAALFPVTAWYPSRKRWGLHVHDQVHVPETGERAEKIQMMTQQVADGFASAIDRHPQDWHMLQKVWTADLDPARATTAAPIEI